MSVPFYLQQGYCLIYGRDLSSTAGITPTNVDWRWGGVYDIQQVPQTIYRFFVGDRVLYNDTEARARLAYATEPNSPYIVYETVKLAGKETGVIPEP